MTRLLLRADASPEIGTGHVLRCLALAHAARARGVSAVFVTAGLPAGLRDRLAREGFAHTPLPQGVEPASTHDAAALRAIGGDACVMDGYHFGPDYQRAARGAFARTMLVDDTAHLDRYEADVVLNHTRIAATAYDGKTDGVRLLGPRYALIRPEFAPKPADEGAADDPTLLVTMGGADPPDATSRVMRALAHPDLSGVRATVVVGPANPRGAALRALAAAVNARSGAHVSVVGPLDDLAAYMRGARVALAAAGGTTWELCALGVPTLLMVIADNQRAFARDVAATGAAVLLGDVASCAEAHVSAAVRALLDDPVARARLRDAARALVDGGGATRALAVLLPPR